MEAKIRIIEVSPKIKCFKNNPKDVISISFISDNYSVKIEDLEKAITSNDKVIVNLKETKNKNNKYQPIKYSLLRNNNNIIATGEFIPSEGIKWYKLNEPKNNMSKESLITSSTSNGNIKNNNNFAANRRAHNLSDSNNSYAQEPLNNFTSKTNFNKLNNNSALNIIKIKFSINLSNKKGFTNKKNMNSSNNTNHYNSTINNNYTKEPSESSSKYAEILFDRDIFNDEEFTITESEINRFNQMKNIITTSKKSKNPKKFMNGIQSKRFSKKKINFHSNSPGMIQVLSGGEDSTFNTKTILTSLNNSKAFSPSRKINNLINKKYFNEDIRMKTSMCFFNKRKNISEIKCNNENKENKFIIKKSSKGDENHRKINSCENIEDEILDQNFKNYLKNDEILKANLSRNNSFNSLTQNNNGVKGSNQHNTYSTYNNDLSSNTNRSKILKNNETNNNNVIYNNNTINNNQSKAKQDIYSNSLFADIQLLKTNSDLEYGLSPSISKNITSNNENNSLDKIITNNNNENFERLKSDFLLLYSKESLNKINNDVIFLELQLMIEKILAMQNKHQKEYIEISNSININKKIVSYYQNKYISLIKLINKLNTKKIYNDIRNKKKDIFNENINNFIKIRKNIMNKGEFMIWNKMLENSNRSKIKTNTKNKIINIFLNICGKNENSLNKLSLKFYKEIKNIKNKKSSSNNINSTTKKKNKFNYNSTFSEKKIINIKSKIKDNDTEGNIPVPYMRTNHNMQNNFKSSSNKNKVKMSKKNSIKLNTNKDDKSNAKNNNMNFGTMISDNTSSNFNKKIKYKNKSSSIGDKKYHKKRGVNKSQ